MGKVRSVDLAGPWSVLSRAPMVRYTVPMMLGIGTARTFDPSPEVSVPVLLFFTIAALVVLRMRVSYERRWLRGAIVLLWMFSFGFTWMAIRDRTARPSSIVHQLGNEGPWLVRTSTLNRITPTQVRADAEVEAFHAGDGTWGSATGTIMLTLLRDEADEPIKVGDRLLIEAPMKRILRIPDPGGFDRKIWAAARGIELELFAIRDQWKKFDHRSTWFDRFSSMRNRIGEWIDASELNDRERALVKALVLGQRDELDGEQKKAFAESGTIHVLAVSGMHVGLIYAILTMLFSRSGDRKPVRMLRGLVILAALWWYAGITGGAPSILRATVMFSFITMADMATKRTDPYNSLFAAGFILLLIDPDMLVNIGFQLSFLAVLGIVIFFRPLEDLWSPRAWILRQIWSLASLSIAAQAFTTPVSIYYFKAFPMWFLPANIIVVTAVSLAVYASIALIVLHKIPIIAGVFTGLLTLLLKIVSVSTGYFASLPFAYPAIRIDLVMVITFYVAIIGLAGWWLWKWRSMRYVLASACVIMLLAWANSARKINRSTTFTLYDERVGVMAGITIGREHLVMADRDRLSSDPFLERKIQQHRKARGLAPVQFIDPESISDTAVHELARSVAAAGRWRTDRFDILFVPGQFPIGIDEQLDAVIFHDRDRITEGDLQQAAAVSDRIVLAGRNPYSVRERVAAWCEDHRVGFHDVFAQGAFILER